LGRTDFSAVAAVRELSRPSRRVSNYNSVVKLTIRIDDPTLLASFGIGLIKRKVPLAEIVRCEPIRIRWWYGWGIHLTQYGWLYNVAGWDAVAITLRDGRKFALGTDDPHGLADAIRLLIDEQG
jgi:hypothetical protein